METMTDAIEGKVHWLMTYVEVDEPKRTVQFIECMLLKYLCLKHLKNEINGHNPYKGKIDDQTEEDIVMFYVMKTVMNIAVNKDVYEIEASLKEATLPVSSDRRIIEEFH